jgi:large subunit ribosomal protein L11
MEKVINVIVEGGKASAGPPLGPALGPLGINTQAVIAEINKQTAAFGGMKVPVSVIVDPKTKTYKIEVRSPPTSELIKREAGIQKGAATKEAAVGDISIEKVITIAKQKAQHSLAKSLRDVVKEVLGTCVSMGVTVDGKSPKQLIKDIDAGKYKLPLGDN